MGNTRTDAVPLGKHKHYGACPSVRTIKFGVSYGHQAS